MFGLLRGIATELREKATAKSSVLVLGIDGAGKTTVVESLMRLAVPSRKPKTIRPTTGLNTETISEGRLFIRFWDLGGSPSFRSLWRDYLADATAIVYVVNGSQADRLHETRKLFDDIAVDFHRSIAIAFVNADRGILEVFPSADRTTVFFVDLVETGELRRLYEWLRHTAVIVRR
jgi:GTPase SAR1 family protein